MRPTRGSVNLSGREPGRELAAPLYVHRASQRWYCLVPVTFTHHQPWALPRSAGLDHDQPWALLLHMLRPGLTHIAQPPAVFSAQGPPTDGFVSAVFTFTDGKPLDLT